jgi:hypothetical protein
VIGIFDQDYVWHELAQTWQTPGAGESFVAEMFGGDVEALAATLHEAGMSRAVAQQVALGQDQAVGEAVLALYRSAAQPVMAELGRNLERAAQRPGLALLPTEDHYVGTDEQRRRAARRAEAQVEPLEGLGHWWMTQDPARGARILTDWWTSLSSQ